MSRRKVLETHELPIGSKRVVKVKETEVLLIHSETNIAAVQSKCPHAGAPLVEGAVCNGKLICPWHMGTFALPGGELLEPPAIEPLKSYPVQICDEGIFVDDEANTIDVKPIAPVGDNVLLIVGAGAAGSMAAATLREKRYTGRIVVVDPVKEEPVDRTQLSKDGLAGKVPLGQISLGALSTTKTDRVYASVKALSAVRHEARLSDGSTIRFDRALIATGGTPRHLDVPGAKLAFTIRHVEDVKRIHEGLTGKKEVVILGGSFIALEAASALVERGLKVTVAAREPLPFAKQFGDRAATALKQLHELNGTNFRLGVEILAITSKDVMIRDGCTEETLEADMVVAGVGVEPALAFTHDLPLADQGGIRVETSLRAAADVWVAGDIAAVNDIRVEHWRVAQQQGRIAALAMMGSEARHESVPFFWTYHFGKRIDYVGHSKNWDEIVFDGDPKDMKFIAFYLKHKAGKRIVEAVLSCERERETAMISELMRTPITFAQAQQAIL